MLQGSIQFYLLLGIISFGSAEDDLLVDLPYGTIRGIVKQSYDGNDYYAFQEIPYAAPPVGPKRFKEPENPESWKGVLNTTKITKQCMQEPFRIFPVDPLHKQTEDCLVINVYTPQKPGSNSSIPVLFYIHGGAFLMGSGDSLVYNPRSFMDYNIIVVTFNYRLGALGFLTTGDGVIPGNLGLKDQLFALKWVNSYIHLFGGDPNKVTIGGASAGAFSVGYHLLEENTKGLFRAAIQESGSSMCQMSYVSKARENAFQLGKALDETFSSEKSEDLLELLLNVPAENIAAASKKLPPSDNNLVGNATNLKWLPVIENKNDTNAFITAPMHESFWNGNFHKVPILLGFNSEESLTFLDDTFESLGEKYDTDLTLLLNSEFHISEANATYLGSQIRKMYTDSLFDEDEAALVKYFTDLEFTNAMLRQAELSAQYVPTYFYQFSFMGTLGSLINQNRYRVPGAEGVGHGEEILYMWDTIPPFTADDILTFRRMLLMWTNFIKYLNPTPQEFEELQNVIWPTVQNGSIQFLNINKTLEVQSDPRYYSKIRDLILEYIEPPYTIF